MKYTMRVAVLSIALMTTQRVLFLSAQANITGVWLATGVPYEPWTVELKQDGTKLTGTMQQNGGLRGPVDIYEGTINGNVVSFKANSPDGARAITFTGTVSGNEITLNRSTQNITNASQGGTGLFGSNAAPQFAIRRSGSAATAPASTSATATPVSGAATTADASGREHWEAAGVAFAPWTFDLKIEGNTVTGVAGQARSDPASSTITTLAGPFEIFDGKADGNTIDFKLKTDDGGRIITFHGVRNGDRIAFTRSVEVVRGDPGRNGILGATGATEFTAALGTANVSAATAAPPSPNVNRPATAPTAPAPTGASGRWQAAEVPNAPWTFELTVNGTSLTGTVQQSGAQNTPMSIAAGKVNGTTITFKVLSPDAERLITFDGRVNRDEISFARQVTVLAGGTRGGNDLYGAPGPLQFIARRVVPNRFNFKDVEIDIAAIQSVPNRENLLEDLRRQIDIIDNAVVDPAQKAFLKAVPMIIPASIAGADNAAYSGGTRGVTLASQSYSREKPIILHELLHAYHDQKLPNGFNNADVQRLYQQARSSGKFPPNSYMLSNAVEYFAMMASVYLHGTAARDPFTREAIKEKQPECYAWLQKEFGPK